MSYSMLIPTTAKILLGVENVSLAAFSRHTQVSLTCILLDLTVSGSELNSPSYFRGPSCLSVYLSLCLLFTFTSQARSKLQRAVTSQSKQGLLTVSMTSWTAGCPQSRVQYRTRKRHESWSVGGEEKIGLVSRPFHVLREREGGGGEGEGEGEGTWGEGAGQ